MAAYVVWIDSHEAKLFNLTASGSPPTHVQGHGKKHHKEPYGKHSQGHHPEAEKLFKEVCPHLGSAKEILIVGPGEAKVHFKDYLEKHFSKTLGEAVVGVQTVDHPTDNQIKEVARKFFKEYDLFH